MARYFDNPENARRAARKPRRKRDLPESRRTALKNAWLFLDKVVTGQVNLERPANQIALATARFLIDHAGRKPSALELELYEHDLSIELDGLAGGNSR